MKYIYLLAFIALVTSCNNRQRGSGNIVTEKRNTGSFSEIKVSSSIDVDVQQGNETSVVVEADDNIVQLIKTNVENGVLVISLKDNYGISNATTTVHVISPVYTSFTASSSSSITGKTTIANTTKINLKASSSANIEMTLDAPSVEIKSSSSADITAAGKTKNLKVDASSSATIKLGELKAEVVDVEASSSSDVKVFASVSLKANAHSSADIVYTGGATDVVKSEKSSSSVTKQ
jgi:Putative auto-transporter adhesin, head GIN domain